MKLVMRSALLVSVLVVAVVGLSGKIKKDTPQASESGASAEDEIALFVG